MSWAEFFLTAALFYVLGVASIVPRTRQLVTQLSDQKRQNVKLLARTLSAENRLRRLIVPKPPTNHKGKT